jgi:hypothetical protein
MYVSFWAGRGYLNTGLHFLFLPLITVKVARVRAYLRKPAFEDTLMVCLDQGCIPTIGNTLTKLFFSVRGIIHWIPLALICIYVRGLAKMFWPNTNWIHIMWIHTARHAQDEPMLILPPPALPSLSVETSSMDLNRGAAAPHELNRGARRRGSRALRLVPIDNFTQQPTKSTRDR